MDSPPYLTELAPWPACSDARLERHICHANELAALLVLSGSTLLDCGMDGEKTGAYDVADEKGA